LEADFDEIKGISNEYPGRARDVSGPEVGRHGVDIDKISAIVGLWASSPNPHAKIPVTLSTSSLKQEFSTASAPTNA